jgi:hypothetical protein
MNEVINLRISERGGGGLNWLSDCEFLKNNSLIWSLIQRLISNSMQSGFKCSTNFTWRRDFPYKTGCIITYSPKCTKSDAFKPGCVYFAERLLDLFGWSRGA